MAREYIEELKRVKDASLRSLYVCISEELLRRGITDEKRIKEISDKIYAEAMSKVTAMYDVGYGNFNIEEITDKFGTLTSEPAFANWVWIIYHIIYWQSLGDTLGYYNGKWEFNYNNPNAEPEEVNRMLYEFISLGGVNDISINGWSASDDTVLYLDTMEVLLNLYLENKEFDNNDLGEKLRDAYLKSLPDLEDRHPGVTTINSLEMQKTIKWDQLPYNNKAIGNGSAMRSGYIGVFFLGSSRRVELIHASIICSKITHNSAIAILGSITSALFTAFALERSPINKWPSKLIRIIDSDIIDNIIKEERPQDYDQFARGKLLYVGQWRDYTRKFFSGLNPILDQKWMQDPVERYRYLANNFSKGCDFPGGCADDCLIMAYDSLLRSNGSYEKLLVLSILHPGDSDTVGSIAFSWYGAYYCNPRNSFFVKPMFSELEFKKRIKEASDKILKISIPLFYDHLLSHVVRKYLSDFLDKLKK